MNCRAQLKVVLNVMALLVCLSGVGATFANGSHGNNHGIAVAGVAIGLEYEKALKSYPTAEIEKQTANCYR